MYHYIKYSAPIGTLSIVEQNGSLYAMVLNGQKYETDHVPKSAIHQSTAFLKKVEKWLDAYFAGQNPVMDLPLAQRGTPFQQSVWKQLGTIPYGQTTSYGNIAELLHTSARAVGQAVGRNPYLIVVPCHRVVSSTGQLQGFAAGLEVKRQLLELEKTEL